MFYRKEKLMKFLFPLLFLVACSGTSQGEYRKKYHVEDFTSTMAPAELHGILVRKMKKCYPQSDYPTYEKTVFDFNPEKQLGTITYEVDTQSIGPQPLVVVEVMNEPAGAGGSLVKVYAKGEILRPGTIYSHQIHKWIDGKKVDCDSQGEI